MNASSPSNQAANTRPQKAPSQPGIMGSVSALLTGPFGLLRSPLFYLASATVGLLAWLSWLASGNVLITAVVALALELLVALLTWQFLLLSMRLQDLGQRTDTLQHGTETWRAGAARAAHGFTHRMLGEIGGDQSRILQSAEEMRTALRLFSGHLETLAGHQDQAREALSKQALETRQNVVELSQQLGEANRIIREQQAAALETILARLDDGLSALATREQLSEAVGSLSESIGRAPVGIGGPRGDSVKALEVATAMDRLNLEVRRQLAALREELRGD